MMLQRRETKINKNKTIHWTLLQVTRAHTPYSKIVNCGASLVAQWLRIHLLMQGTQVRALVREDPTC